ncbi:hypothetical protein [Thalassolituus oleivorans]|uniref:Uncharacterized protein n=1 Tax=Thalassolituus oleivorans MIL-1 TaxID=1298593 RepID=M5DN85_9GAMM|nr:hypothetical protein [Thalassolituus oleivorans]CCU70908.1 hypothetical protein TOL_0469 [Thalassolituus oleivorans MIL-1]
MNKVTVDAEALRKILSALNGPDHLIREIQVTSDFNGQNCPITTLTKQWNDANLAAAVHEQETRRGCSDDAARYRWLRDRDINQIELRGLFVGQTPENIVINGIDLDKAVDVAMSTDN